MAITLTVILVISMHSAIVFAKGKPEKPLPERAPFRICVGNQGDDIVLIETVEDYPDPGTSWFDVTSYVDDWDYTGGVTGGEPRERYQWNYYDGGWGFPFIAFGRFAMSDDLLVDNGFDWRPDDEIAELFWISHRVIPDYEMAYWRIFLNWTTIYEDRVVDVQLFGRTSNDANDEGTPVVNDDGEVESWMVTFTPENSEFKLQYSYFDTKSEQIGKSGKVRESTTYISNVIWDYGEAQPTLTMTVRIERSPDE